MKLWKYILGAIAFIGGLLVVKSSKDKKEFEKKLEDNQDKVKVVKAKVKKAEAKKAEVKKAIKKQEVKVAKAKAKVKDTTSAKKTAENFEKKYPENTKLKGKISNIKDFSIYVNIEEFDIDGFLHANDLSYTGKPEDEIKKYKEDTF